MKKQTSLFCANHGQIHSNWSQRWKCFVCLCFSFSILAKVHKILKSVWKRNCVNRAGHKETLYVIEKDVTIKCSAPFWPFMTFLFHFSNVWMKINTFHIWKRVKMELLGLFLQLWYVLIVRTLKNIAICLFFTFISKINVAINHE